MASLPFVAEYDDYPRRAAEMIDCLDYIKERAPEFKATLFAIPAELNRHTDAMRWARERKDWLRLGVHGHKHRRKECRYADRARAARMLAEAEASGFFSKIVKPPCYSFGRDYVLELHARGYAISCRTPRDYLRRFRRPLDCPAIPVFAKHHWPLELFAYGHPEGTPRMFARRCIRSAIRRARAAGSHAFTEDVARPPLRLYLGSGDDWKEGFVHLDKHEPGATRWEWGQPLPCPAGGADYVLVQHSLMYADPDMIPDILSELRRALCDGGTLVIKEDDDRHYRWREPGERGVRSVSEPESMARLLEAADFWIRCADPHEMLDRHPGMLNRRRRLARGRAYALEAIAGGLDGCTLS